MKVKILLDHNANLVQIEREEKQIFLKNILEQIGVPINELWNADIELSIELQMKINDLMKKYLIQVVDENGGDMNIYVEQEKIATWYKPFYKLKKDITNLDPKNQMFLEMEIDTWSILESE